MFKTELTFDLKLLETFPKLIKSIRKNVIENGVDETLNQSISELKEDLYYIINEKIPALETSKSSTTLGLPEVELPKSDQELLNHFTGIDLTKIRTNKDYTSAVESNVLLSNDYRLRLRLPIGPDESLAEDFEKAVKFFNTATIVFKDGAGKVQYYLNPGIDMRQYVKIVCSRDTGITERTEKKFNAYKNSNRMTRQSNSDMGRFSEWSLTQQGARFVRDSFINITTAMDFIKQGNYEQATAELSKNKNGPKVQDFIDKTQDLKNDSNLKPDTQVYNNILKLIKNVKIIKSIKIKEITYSLLTSYDGNDNHQFFEEMDELMVLWHIENDRKWFNALVNAAEKVIAEYEGQ